MISQAAMFMRECKSIRMMKIPNKDSRVLDLDSKHGHLHMHFDDLAQVEEFVRRIDLECRAARHEQSMDAVEEVETFDMPAPLGLSEQ